MRVEIDAVHIDGERRKAADAKTIVCLNVLLDDFRAAFGFLGGLFPAGEFRAVEPVFKNVSRVGVEDFQKAEKRLPLLTVDGAVRIVDGVFVAAVDGSEFQKDVASRADEFRRIDCLMIGDAADGRFRICFRQFVGDGVGRLKILVRRAVLGAFFAVAPSVVEVFAPEEMAMGGWIQSMAEIGAICGDGVESRFRAATPVAGSDAFLLVPHRLDKEFRMSREDIAREKIVGGVEFVFVVDARRLHVVLEFNGRAVCEMFQDIVARPAAGMEA